MDKVEAYLDRVCRGIAGPRALRAHVRQELREHLEDAAARHVAAGMPEDEAMDLALEGFGGPDEVAGYGLPASIEVAWFPGDHDVQRVPQLGRVADRVAEFVLSTPPR